MKQGFTFNCKFILTTRYSQKVLHAVKHKLALLQKVTAHALFHSLLHCLWIYLGNLFPNLINIMASYSVINVIGLVFQRRGQKIMYI